MRLLSLCSYTVSVHCPQWLNFEALKLLNFDFNAGPDTQPWFLLTLF
jgi:hypothetical protein